MEEERTAERLAILNMCLSANEYIESKPICTYFRYKGEKNLQDGSMKTIRKERLECEIFLTNYRLLLVLYLNVNNNYEEHSVYFCSTSDLSIVVPKNIPEAASIS